jgi:S-adenosylmethionine hydrolase
MAIVTLTSDMGHRDHYVAAVKIAILRHAPEAHIMDISHEVEHFDIQHAAYILRQVYKDFPAGTTHIIGIQPEWSKERAHVIVKSENQYFISADNGLFSFLLDREPEEVFEIDLSQDTDDLTFPAKNIFAKVAAHLSKGGTPEVLSRPYKLRSYYTPLRPILDDNSIRGHVMHVDSYENILSNISLEHFKEVGRGRDFEVRFARHRVKRIVKSYSEVSPGDALAIFRSNGLLEIAINQGTTSTTRGAAALFGLKKGDTVRIDFL